MIFLVLSILTTSLLFYIFKWFDLRGVDNRQAIVVNYFVAFGVGLVAHPSYLQTAPFESDWLPVALVLGVLFIFLFNVLGLTAQRIALSVASVANKMSVAVPVVVAFWLYDDEVTLWKLIGIVLALLGVWLTSRPSSTLKIDKKDLWLPVVLFLGSGLIDTLIKYTQHTYLHSEAQMLTFIPTIFLVAGCLGTLFLLATNNWRISAKNLLWGAILGVPNYFSIYLIIQALDKTGWQSSVVFPVNNIGVVVVSVIGGLVLFREKLSLISFLGILLSLLGIAFIGFLS